MSCVTSGNISTAMVGLINSIFYIDSVEVTFEALLFLEIFLVF